jgi:hypothetical protein
LAQNVASFFPYSVTTSGEQIHSHFSSRAAMAMVVILICSNFADRWHWLHHPLVSGAEMLDL